MIIYNKTYYSMLPPFIRKTFYDQAFTHCPYILNCWLSKKFEPCLSSNVASNPLRSAKHRRLKLNYVF